MRLAVNNVVVSEEAVNLESARVEAGGIAAKRQEAARRLTIRELLRQRAETIGVASGDEFDVAIDALLAAEVRVPAADDPTCRRYFEANRHRFHAAVEIELRHILLAAAPDDPRARARARDTAESLIATLYASPARFAELAARHSRCPSADRDGYLGVISRGHTVPELEAVVLRLPPGLVRRPVESRYGFHVVEILARTGGEPLAYEAVAHLIADYLSECAWRRAVSQYIGRLAADAKVEGIDLQAPDSPPVQ